MNEKEINEILDQLRDGVLTEYYVTKEDFLPFRTVLVHRQDFKHFRGIAQRGGDVIYEYVSEARS
ncbi:hypothetical protein A8F94_12145 [Bacillus sp. FJAT-27225]|uniref:hypothetical protein n=1 Tax=Bacillus sp. FJAT-27225 TaxID=1743144 RepID=UPI00080C3279|nr:hypothetical protein [Bacillus sp. FJAT-27225]OCA85625.1 hypothetical protein A8F94_12145 [Bacillus sp. FJAT-27225]